jgi:hypothetical protein
VENRGRLDLLLGDIELFKIEALLYSIVTSKVNSGDPTIYAVEESIRQLGKNYDYIVIDTSPSANSILNGVLVMMSDYLICPAFPNFFSLQAIDNLFEVMKNWINLLADFRATTNYKGLSFSPKFLGIIINMAKRFEYIEDQDGGKAQTRTTIYAEKWRDRLNKSIEKFYLQVLDSGRTVTKSEFATIFKDENKQSSPFIIEEISDFTGQIRNISEISGIPVVDLNDQIVRDTVNKHNSSSLGRSMQSFKIESKEEIKPNEHYKKAFKSVIESYNFIASCIAKNI